MTEVKPRLFETALALKAMMNLGYKTTDFALAEIIDNSIEAGAENIDVAVIQSLGGKSRSVWQIKKICVLDDGSGIEPDLLSRVLSFGYGTHRDASVTPDAESFGKLGKFGVGLPNASISQAKDIYVYSWQNGINSTFVSELLVDKILSGDADSQTPAQQIVFPQSLNQVFTAMGAELKKSGTCVVWDRVTDRCSWSKGVTLLDKVELLVGRIFRKFINNKKVKIRIAIFNDSDLSSPIIKPQFVRANDPMFLMHGTIADGYRELDKIPIPSSESLFYPVPPQSIDIFDIKVPFTNKYGNQDEALVKIRFSKCRPELRKRVNKVYAGATKVGQIAGDNQGVSILRAGRELELSKTWLLSEDTRNRWIGAEIDFPPALDEYFGVGSTKQSADKLEALAKSKFNADDILAEFNEQWAAANPHAEPRKIIWSEMIEMLRAADDKRWLLYSVAKVLSSNIKNIFSELKKDTRETVPPGATIEPQTKGSDGALGGNATGKEATKFMKPKGDQQPANLNENEVKKLSVVATCNPDEPTSSEDDVFEYERVVQFLKDHPDAPAVFSNSKIASNAFFDCMQEFGRIVIRFNKGHPAYDVLFQQFGKVLDDAANPNGTLEQRFENVDLLKISFLLMLFAWAQTETSLSDDDMMVARSIRDQWGSSLRKLIKELDKQRNN